jgi:peptide/nickel transport system ATP-binding protein
MTPIWEAVQISKSYSLGRGPGKKKRISALHGVSLAVEPGEILALVGESGSGKSTLARLALALEKPDSGYLSFRQKSYSAWLPPKNLYRHIQMVFQSTAEAADPAWTAREVIAEPLVHLTSLPAPEREARVLAAAAEAGFPSELLAKPVAALSGGQRQRACIARAIAVRPRFLVLDEPTSGLDVLRQEQILSLLQDLALNLSVSMLLITHDLRAAARCARRIAFLRDGVLVETAFSSRLAELRHPYARMLYEASL